MCYNLSNYDELSTMDYVIFVGEDVNMATNNNANIGFEKQIWDAACVLWGHIPAAYLAQHPGAVVNITCRASPCFLHIFYNAANPIFSE